MDGAEMRRRNRLGDSHDGVLLMEDVAVSYNDLIALEEVNLDLSAGEAAAVIGPSGAGKTTLLRTVAGMLPQFGAHVVRGRIVLLGKDVTGSAPHVLYSMGVHHVMEGRRVLEHLSVQQNLIIGAKGIVLNRRSRKRLEWVYEAFPFLSAAKRRMAGYLSGGERQLLVICRAYVAEPKLLAVDEPFLGLAPLLADRVSGVLRKMIEDDGVSLLIADQNLKKLSGLAEIFITLQGGRVVEKRHIERI